MSKEKLEELVEIRGKVLATKLPQTDLKHTSLGYANKVHFKIMAINSLTNTDWKNPIIAYLKDPTTDVEKKVKYRALSYILIGNKLFKKTPEVVLLKCLG